MEIKRKRFLVTQGVAALDGDGDDGGGGSGGGGGESSGRSTGSPAELRLGATAASLQHAGLLSAAEPRQFALEADYIQRTLGHLTPLQVPVLPPSAHLAAVHKDCHCSHVVVTRSIHLKMSPLFCVCACVCVCGTFEKGNPHRRS